MELGIHFRQDTLSPWGYRIENNQDSTISKSTSHSALITNTVLLMQLAPSKFSDHSFLCPSSLLFPIHSLLMSASPNFSPFAPLMLCPAHSLVRGDWVARFSSLWHREAANILAIMAQSLFGRKRRRWEMRMEEYNSNTWAIVSRAMMKR